MAEGAREESSGMRRLGGSKRSWLAMCRERMGKEGNDAGEERDVMRGRIGEKVDIRGRDVREGVGQGNTARRRGAN